MESLDWDVLQQQLRLLNLLEQRERARKLIKGLDTEIAETRGIVAGLAHGKKAGRDAPADEESS